MSTVVLDAKEGHISDDPQLTINFGPQHPAAHGVLLLQRKIRRTGTIER